MVPSGSATILEKNSTTPYPSRSTSAVSDQNAATRTSASASNPNCRPNASSAKIVIVGASCSYQRFHPRASFQESISSRPPAARVGNSRRHPANAIPPLFLSNQDLYSASGSSAFGRTEATSLKEEYPGSAASIESRSDSTCSPTLRLLLWCRQSRSGSSLTWAPIFAPAVVFGFASSHWPFVLGQGAPPTHSSTLWSAWYPCAGGGPCASSTRPRNPEPRTVFGSVRTRVPSAAIFS